MRAFFALGCLIALPCAAPASVHSQQLVPVIRQVSDSSFSVSEWKAFVRVADYGGYAYISLAQAAALFNGHLRWSPVSKSVDLSVRGQTVRFYFHSPRVLLAGRPGRLERTTVRNEDGFWVPASFFASPAFFRLMRIRLDWPPPSEERPKEVIPAKAGTHHPSRNVAVDPRLRGDDIKVRAIRRIVIDPGHGGKDPGAVGPRGLAEKAVNLLVAQELADVLRERHDYEVLLTRMDDTFVPLEARAELANKHNADLFISIHCNASLSSKLKGFEVYFLSEKASDPHADAVARLENAPLALEGKTVPTPGQLGILLRSLVKNANINEASALGALVERQVSERLSRPSLGVKQAAFYVLRGAEMPAILLETGFLSNPKEERLLQNASHRLRMVEGIAAGIAVYDQRKQKDRR